MKTIFPDPNDPRLLQITNPNGTQVTYFGTKANGTGGALAYNQFIIQEDVKKIIGSLDSSGRPTSLLAHDGSRIEINWISASVMVVTYITGDGNGQVITEIDLEKLAAEQDGAGKRRLDGTSQTRGKSRQLAERHLRESIARHLQPPPSSGTGTATVKLLRCGTEPVTDAIVGVDVRFESATGSFRTAFFPAQHTGSGVYSVDFSLDSLGYEETQLQDACETLAEVLGVACDDASTIPPILVPSICDALSLPLGGFAPADFVACEAALLASSVACNTFGASPPANFSPNVQSTLCGAMSQLNAPDPIVAEQVTIHPFVLSPDGVVFEPQTVSASGPYPTFATSVVGGDEPMIVSFTINPADPAPSQDYMATAKVTCANSIRLNITGTDNYTDAKTCNVTFGASGTVECELIVPGGEAGIFDNVTVFVNGEPARVIGIVF